MAPLDGLNWLFALFSDLDWLSTVLGYLNWLLAALGCPLWLFDCLMVEDELDFGHGLLLGCLLASCGYLIDCYFVVAA